MAILKHRNKNEIVNEEKHIHAISLIIDTVKFCIDFIKSFDGMHRSFQNLRTMITLSQ